MRVREIMSRNVITIDADASVIDAIKTMLSHHISGLPVVDRDGALVGILSDGDFIASLMKPVTEIGQYASWISPPKVGIDNKPGDFEYVKIES